MTPETVSALISWFEMNFVCFLGPRSAYFEIETGPSEQLRYVYQTHRVQTSVEVGHEKRLVAWMYNQFAPFAAQYHTLFWRLPQKIILTCELAPEYRDVVATKEQAEDGFSLPSGCLTDEDGLWRLPVTQKDTWVLRTRLVMPALEWSLAQPQATAEGATGVMI